MATGRSFTLSELARDLETPQHRLIHLCEQGVIAPELQDARGRGTSRVFSTRNFLEFAIAIRLRAAMLPVAAVGAVLRVLRIFEGRLHRELTEFSLPESLRVSDAPDLRIIVSDGSIIYFSLALAGGEAKLFGGVPLDQITGDKPPPISSIGVAPAEPTSGNGTNGTGFGGPERSRFVRLELSITEVARDLPLG
jgi:hypothetical protein